eukprot:m.56322 g.56322  ORF g.56322 m.56322 type:complete len:258 (+) comp11555_c0_seq1:184-957(+)
MDTAIDVSQPSLGYDEEFRARMPKVAPSDDSSTCAVCDLPFTFFFPWKRHKRHCASCGKAVCRGCINWTHPLLPAGTGACNTCIMTTLPHACGLLEEPWFHGTVTRSAAETRLRRPDSGIGDFLVRFVHDDDHDQRTEDVPAFVISLRNAPHTVCHILVRGAPGNWHLQPGHPYTTIQQLVKSQQGNDMLDRAAMVEPGDYLSCPTCQAQLPPNQEDISKAEDCFCRKCGSRFLTLPDARELYNKISLEYLKDETET